MPVRSGQGLVLAYHRVIELSSDPYGLCVRPDRFVDHLRCISDHANLVPLDAIRDSPGDQRVAVTFDDGYVDNALTAGPILESLEVPATVFVVASQVGSRREFWWDRLEMLIMEPEASVEPIDFQVGPRITVRLSLKDPYARERTIWTLQNIFMRLRASAIQDLLEDLAGQLRVTPNDRLTHRTVSHSELQDLHKSQFVQIGAHTMTHPALPAISIEERRIEVAHSRAALQDMINCPVRAFAYPFGEYDEESIQVVQEAGLSLGCTSDPGRVTDRTNPFAIPRHLVGDWELERFRTHFLRWMAD